MSRAAQSTTRNLTDQQLTQQNQLISQSDLQGQQDRSLLMPAGRSMRDLLNPHWLAHRLHLDAPVHSICALAVPSYSK